MCVNIVLFPFSKILYWVIFRHRSMYLAVDLKNNGFMDEILDVLTIFCIFFGIYTIISKNPIISVLFLIGLFSGVSVYLILIGLTFIGLSYLLVYIGAVSILFLFILMLINIRISEIISNNNNYLPLALISVITFVYILGQKISLNVLQFNFLNYLPNTFLVKLKYFLDYKEEINFSNSVNWDNALLDLTHTSIIGNIMYSSYSIWLIISSLILLLAMVGSIVITIRS